MDRRRRPPFPRRSRSWNAASKSSESGMCMLRAGSRRRWDGCRWGVRSGGSRGTGALPARGDPQGRAHEARHSAPRHPPRRPAPGAVPRGVRFLPRSPGRVPPAGLGVPRPRFARAGRVLRCNSSANRSAGTGSPRSSKRLHAAGRRLRNEYALPSRSRVGLRPLTLLG